MGLCLQRNRKYWQTVKFPKTHTHTKLSTYYKTKEKFPAIILIFNIIVSLGGTVQFHSLVHIFKKLH